MAQEKGKKVKLDDDVEMGDAPTAPTELIDEGERAGGEDNGDADDGDKAVGKDGQSDDGESAEPKEGRKPNVLKSAEEKAADNARNQEATEAVSHVRLCLWWQYMPPNY